MSLSEINTVREPNSVLPNQFPLKLSGFSEKSNLVFRRHLLINLENTTISNEFCLSGRNECDRLIS